MTIEASLESIAKSLEIIAQVMPRFLPVSTKPAAAPISTTLTLDQQKAAVEQAAAKAVAAQAAQAAAPVATFQPAAQLSQAGSPLAGPLAGSVVPFPASAAAPAAAAPAAPAVPFTNNKGLKDFMVKLFNEKGPTFGQTLGNLLAKYGAADPSEVKPADFAAIYADMVAAAK